MKLTFLISAALFAGFTLKGQTFQQQSQAVQHVDIPNLNSIYVTQPPGSNLCWAACDAMLLRSVGVKVGVRDIVVKAFGSYKDQGAGPSLQMPSDTINDEWPTNSGDSIQVSSSISDGSPLPPLIYQGRPYAQAQLNPDDYDTIVSSLRNGHPVIIASVAHGRVCVGVDYISDGFNTQIVGMRLLNPEPGTGLENWDIRRLGIQMTLNEGGYLGMISF